MADERRYDERLRRRKATAKAEAKAAAASAPCRCMPGRICCLHYNLLGLVDQEAARRRAGIRRGSPDHR